MHGHRLHIGCGDKQLPGLHWTNVDARGLEGIDYVTDLCHLDRYEDDTVEKIYCCHALEHVSHDDAMLALKEWSRVLVPQTGSLRVCVPDMGILCQLHASGTHLGRMRGLIWGGQNYEHNVHYTGWDFEELARDLRECGFFNIAEYNPWVAMLPNIPPVYRDFSFMELNGMRCSLNVEALAK